jgi:pyridoxamine 5'-phosphate oxidase
MKSRLESLHLIERSCWQELERAAHDRDHGWHLLTLASMDGERADARSVILRDVRPAERALVIYTDHRSPKAAQIRARPLGTLVGWSPALSWQLRLQVTLEVERDGLDVSSRWARMKLSASAADYLAAVPPGTPLDNHTPERSSREHFALLVAQITAIDWLELHADGHRRARFDSAGPRWLAP